MLRAFSSAAAFLFLTFFSTSTANSQCEPEWSRQFVPSWPAGKIAAAVNYDDDGNGPNREGVILAGSFLSAGGVAANHIVKWDGTWWSPLGAGLGNSSTAAISIHDMVAFDGDGPGLANGDVWVIGSSSISPGGTGDRIARWNGIEWSFEASPSPGTPICMLVDSTSGELPCLYIAFTSGTIGSVWRLSEGTWTKIGDDLIGDVNNSSTNPVQAMRVFDEDGPGPKLPQLVVAGSVLSTSGGTSVSRVARWNGNAWERLGAAPISEVIRVLEVFDSDGDGPAQSLLIAVGYRWISPFHPASIPINSWNGTTWNSIGTLSVDEGGVWAWGMTVFDSDGSGPLLPRLWMAGRFENIDELDYLNGLAWWDGTNWHGANGTNGALGPLIRLKWPSPAASTPRLLYLSGGTSSRLGDGTTWVSMLGSLNVSSAQFAGPSHTSNVPIGNEIIAAGSFRFGSDFFVYPAIHYDGLEWSPLGGQTAKGNSNRIALADQDGLGPAPPTIIMTGSVLIPGIPQPQKVVQLLNGVWTPIAVATPGSVSSPNGILTTLDVDGPGPFGPQIYVAGQMPTPPATNRVAKWSGVDWEYLPGQFSSSPTCMVVHDEDGDGAKPPRVVAAGFNSVDGVTMNGIACWDGDEWTPLVSSLTGTVGFGASNVKVTALCSFDLDGGGPQLPKLFAAGSFGIVDGVALNRIAFWDGAQWNPMGPGFGYEAESMVGMDEDGAGPLASTIYVAGLLKNSGSQYIKGFAKWNGVTWDPLWPTVTSPYPNPKQILAVQNLNDLNQPPVLWGFGSFNLDGNTLNQSVVRRGIDAPYLHAWSRSQSAVIGGKVALRVAAGGAPPLGYQWRRNGQPLFDGAGISGTTTEEIKIDAFANQDVGQYDCVVSNPCGSATSPTIEIDSCLNLATPDLNGDGAINGLDIQVFVTQYLAASASVPSICQVDLNANHTADVADAVMLVQALIAN